MNKEFISLFQQHQKDYQRFALKICRNPELAEDVLQQTALKILSSKMDFESIDKKDFIFVMIRQVMWRYVSNSKRLSYLDDFQSENDDRDETNFLDSFLQNNIGCEYQSDLSDTMRLNEIRRAARFLPEGQRLAVMSALAGKETESQLQRQLAIINLKEKLA